MTVDWFWNFVLALEQARICGQSEHVEVPPIPTRGPSPRICAHLSPTDVSRERLSPTSMQRAVLQLLGAASHVIASAHRLREGAVSSRGGLGPLVGIGGTSTCSSIAGGLR